MFDVADHLNPEVLLMKLVEITKADYAAIFRPLCWTQYRSARRGLLHVNNLYQNVDRYSALNHPFVRRTHKKHYRRKTTRHLIFERLFTRFEVKFMS